MGQSVGPAAGEGGRILGGAGGSVLTVQQGDKERRPSPHRNEETGSPRIIPLGSFVPNFLFGMAKVLSG